MMAEPTLNDLLEREKQRTTTPASRRSGDTAREPRELNQQVSARMFGHAFDVDQSQADEDSWVTTYMDLLTLLLVLFVVLLANADLTGGNQQDEFSTMQGQIEQQMANSGFGDNVEVSRSPGKINIKLNDKILFDSGEAEFNDSAAQVMAPIVDLLAKNQLMISVEGHTDNVPINTAQFPSNWELSAARAISVVRLLQHQGINGQRLRAIGYADSLPLQSNETAEGRAANRRVNLVLSEPE